MRQLFTWTTSYAADSFTRWTATFTSTAVFILTTTTIFLLACNQEEKKPYFKPKWKVGENKKYEYSFITQVTENGKKIQDIKNDFECDFEVLSINENQISIQLTQKNNESFYTSMKQILDYRGDTTLLNLQGEKIDITQLMSENPMPPIVFILDSLGQIIKIKNNHEIKTFMVNFVTKMFGGNDTLIHRLATKYTTDKMIYQTFAPTIKFLSEIFGKRIPVSSFLIDTLITDEFGKPLKEINYWSLKNLSNDISEIKFERAIPSLGIKRENFTSTYTFNRNTTWIENFVQTYSVNTQSASVYSKIEANLIPEDNSVLKLLSEPKTDSTY